MQHPSDKSALAHATRARWVSGKLVAIERSASWLGKHTRLYGIIFLSFLLMTITELAPAAPYSHRLVKR